MSGMRTSDSIASNSSVRRISRASVPEAAVFT
jgi:hypothetical protein